ncbi:Na channel amiloride sensitive [Schistosoma japonicum]|nr:Na channel amiloride sensitive [Schistosoma japonicum]
MRCFTSVFSQSSLVPLAKIANAPSRSLRLLWAIVTAIMFIGLCVCISLVVLQYLKHQTVFQLDYSGRHSVYDQVPGITICPQSQESKRLFLDAMKRLNIMTQSMPLPWFSKSVLDQFRAEALKIQPDLKFGVIVHRLPKGELLWNTSKTALSPIYRMLLNFSVEFQIQPSYLSDSYRLTVMEQVPNTRNFLCTTFELRSKNVEKSWSYLEIRINQENNAENSNRITFIVITHERGELPFSAYDRHIHTILPPETSVSLYFSKSVTTRLNTARNPCHVGADAKFIASELTMDTESEYNNNEVKHYLPGVTSLYTTSLPKLPINNEMDNYDLNTITNTKSNPNYNDLNEDNNQRKQWYFDYLDTIRMKNKQTTFASETTNYLQFALLRNRQKKSKEQRRSKLNTVSLFGTEFLYSREACGWVECCAKVAYNCNSTCTLDLLSINRTATQSHFLCERSQCQDEQIPYETCPLPCIQTKFIKHSEVRLSGFEDGLPALTSRLKLVRSESVQVATEEEIFSLAKLFSEVGGLCSLFIGFSCIFLFELLEALILMYYPKNNSKQTNKVNTISNTTTINSNNSSHRSEINKTNDQKCLSTPLIEVNKHTIDNMPSAITDSMINSTTTTMTTTNVCSDSNGDNIINNSNNKPRTPKASFSIANIVSLEKYLSNDTEYSTENRHFTAVYPGENDNGDLEITNSHLASHVNNYHVDESRPLENVYNCDHTDKNKAHETLLSVSNQRTHHVGEILESNRKYMLPIWLTTSIPLHMINDRQISSKSNINNQDECMYSRTTTVCSREELIQLLQENRIRIKVMFTEQ